MIYWLHRVATFLVRFVPLRLAYALASLLALATPVLWPQHYRRAEANLAKVLGPGHDPRELRRLVRRTFQNYALYIVDLLRLPHTDPEEIRRRMEVRGWERVEEARHSGRGIVFVSGHIGSFDVGPAVLVAKGMRVNAIVETLKPARWNECVQRLRQLCGVRPLPIETGVREMFQALKRGEALGVLIDRPLPHAGVPVEFFDAPTRVPGGVATLAIRTGAAVFAVGVIRDGDRYVGYVSPRLDLERTGDPAADIQALTQRVMDWLENLIRQYPDQWFMFRDFWPRVADSRP
jgi:KDO2-lipid IV(A) lauroyltransferase